MWKTMDDNVLGNDGKWGTDALLYARAPNVLIRFQHYPGHSVAVTPGWKCPTLIHVSFFVIAFSSSDPFLYFVLICCLFHFFWYSLVSLISVSFVVSPLTLIIILPAQHLITSPSCTILTHPIFPPIRPLLWTRPETPISKQTNNYPPAMTFKLPFSND